MYEDILLDPEQRELLGKLVEAERTIPRHQRHEFFVARTLTGSSVIHAGVDNGEMPVHYPDIVVLADAGLLRLSGQSADSPSFFVTPQGFAYHDELRKRSEEPASEGVSAMKYEMGLPTRIRILAKRIFARETGLSGREIVEFFCQHSDEIPEYPWSPALAYRAEYFDTCLRYFPPDRQGIVLLELCNYTGAMSYGPPSPEDLETLRGLLMGRQAPPPVRYVPPGTQLEAYVSLKEVIGQARETLMLVDPYVNEATLLPLISLGPAITVRILTVDPPMDFGNALAKFKAQWGGNAQARAGRKDLHDRFLVVDDNVYQSGASFKDLGLRGSVLSEIQAEPEKTAIRDDIEAAWNAATPIQ